MVGGQCGPACADLYFAIRSRSRRYAANAAGRRGFLCVAKALHGLLAASAALTACGGGSASSSAGASVSNRVHEPISICAPSRSVKDLIDVVHKYYPEIVFNVDAYSGPNGTIYMQDQLEADCQADVYSITYTARRLRHDPDGHADAGDERSGSHPCHPQRQKPAGQDDPHPCHDRQTPSPRTWKRARKPVWTSICPSRWTLRCWSVLSGSTLLPPLRK